MCVCELAIPYILSRCYMRCYLRMTILIRGLFEAGSVLYCGLLCTRMHVEYLYMQSSGSPHSEPRCGQSDFAVYSCNAARQLLFNQPQLAITTFRAAKAQTSRRYNQLYFVSSEISGRRLVSLALASFVCNNLISNVCHFKSIVPDFYEMFVRRSHILFTIRSTSL